MHLCNLHTGDTRTQFICICMYMYMIFCIQGDMHDSMHPLFRTLVLGIPCQNGIIGNYYTTAMKPYRLLPQPQKNNNNFKGILL
jgi:hypothetical protein